MAHQPATTFFIRNLHCPSCISNIETSLAALGVSQNSISHSIVSHLVTVRHDAALSVDTLTDALEQAGFEVEFSTEKTQADGYMTWPKDRINAESSGDWGLEQAYHRLAQVLKDPDLEATRKRKRHMETCTQCQNERNADSSDMKLPAVGEHEDFKDGTGRLSTSSGATDTGSPPLTVVAASPDTPKTYQATLAITGMTCSACVGNVDRAIKQNSWVEDVNVMLLSNSATVKFRGKGNEAKVVESIEDAGYDASLEDVQELRQAAAGAKRSDVWTAVYSVSGMTCSACVGAITNVLREPEWIEESSVNLISNSATVTFHGKHHLEDVKELIEDVGYDASLQDVFQKQEEATRSNERNVAIRVDGMYCHHCPSRVVQAITEKYGERVKIERPLSQKDPILRIRYEPQLPDFTLRHIIRTIEQIDNEMRVSVYHPPTVEEKSQEIHAKERRRILLRLALSVIVAIPTFIIGIVFMSLVKSGNPGRQYLMRPMWAGRVPRSQWALFFMSTVIYFLAADIFHIRTFEGIRAMWRPGSPVPVLERFYRFGSMNMLITLGTSIAYFASIAELAINASQSVSSDSESSSSYYFDSVVFLTMFLLVGRFLEAYSKARTGDAVASLGRLRPTEALLVSQDAPTESKDNASIATENKISVDVLEIGDVVRVPHGSTPPFDGTVSPSSPATTFDESSLTGESRPVPKHPGDTVYAGTINTGNTPITVRIATVSGASMLDQIIAAVREGQTRRAPVERAADAITSHFVPFVVAAGILTWIVWLALGLSGRLPRAWLGEHAVGGWPFWALQFSIAVFVIACPCGIGLAAPTALFVGGGLAAKHGILVKGGGEAFQEASMLDCVVFDKTGTLTEGGQPRVTDHVVVAVGVGNEGTGHEGFAMGVARALEENSGHPIASSIVRFCRGLEAEGDDAVGGAYDVSEIPGKGLKGSVRDSDGQEVTAVMGNEALMADYAVTIDKHTAERLEVWKTEGKSIALLATTATAPATGTTTRGTGTSTSTSTGTAGAKQEPRASGFTLAAAFAISDALRPEASSVIAALHKLGLQVWLLSGDNATTATAVGRRVGIPASNIIAGVLPEQKASRIKYLQRTLAARSNRKRWLSRSARAGHATVAMVGDGINDAPALATADVGIAIGSGSDVALSTAAFVLVTSDLRALLTLVQLSRTVFRRVCANFVWALVYNVVAMPIAAGVLYPVRSAGGVHVRLDPVWASLAMALSSVSVVSSSLALRTRVPWVGFRGVKVVVEEEPGEEMAPAQE